MSYAPTTDFLALLRNTSGGLRTERMPGLDYLIAGLARAQMFLLWTGAEAPTTNQTTTVWLLPASPSWVAEGAVFLYSGVTGEYEPATPELWATLFSAGGRFSQFQSITIAADTIDVATTLAAIRRVAPTTQAILLPSVLTRSAVPLQIVDWSTNVVENEITLTAAVGETISQQATFRLFSTTDQLAGITLHPSPDLNGWAIAP